MVEHSNPSYSEIMRELDIPIITGEKSHICNSNLVNLQKSRKISIKSKNLSKLKFKKMSLYFLRYRKPFFYIQLFSQKSRKITNNTKYGGYKA